MLRSLLIPALVFGQMTWAVGVQSGNFETLVGKPYLSVAGALASDPHSAEMNQAFSELLQSGVTRPTLYQVLDRAKYKVQPGAQADLSGGALLFFCLAVVAAAGGLKGVDWSVQPRPTPRPIAPPAAVPPKKCDEKATQILDYLNQSPPAPSTAA